MTLPARPAPAPVRERRLRGATAAAWMACALLAAPHRARADGPAIAVEAVGCDGVRVEEIERLLAIELAGVSLAPPPAATTPALATAPEVHLACEDGSIGITVSDPITDKRLERRVPAPAAGAGRERVIALAISQLFLTSWMELLMSDRAPAATSAPRRPPAGATAAAARLAQRALGPDARRSPWRLELDLLGGARARDAAGEGYPTGAFALRVGLSRGGAWYGWLAGGLEYGSPARASGAVDAYLGHLGVGGSWRSPRVGPLAFELGAEVSAVYARLVGRTALAGVEAATLESFGAQAELSAGPVLALGPLRAGLLVQAGATLPTLVGTVGNGPAVSTGVFWFGGALVLGVDFGPL